MVANGGWFFGERSQDRTGGQIGFHRGALLVFAPCRS
jgi:hypothetical protein